jgi:hypothetical protein
MAVTAAPRHHDCWIFVVFEYSRAYHCQPRRANTTLYSNLHNCTELSNSSGLWLSLADLPRPCINATVTLVEEHLKRLQAEADALDKASRLQVGLAAAVAASQSPLSCGPCGVLCACICHCYRLCVYLTAFLRTAQYVASCQSLPLACKLHAAGLKVSP